MSFEPEHVHVVDGELYLICDNDRLKLGVLEDVYRLIGGKSTRLSTTRTSRQLVVFKQPAIERTRSLAVTPSTKFRSASRMRTES